VVERGFPVLAFRVRGHGYEDMGALIDSLTSRGARVLTVAQDEGAELSLPRELTEPFVAIHAAVRAQQLSLAPGDGMRHSSGPTGWIVQGHAHDMILNF
jgi:fructoselysine-6-P-deglycase FrlB-like protein